MSWSDQLFRRLRILFRKQGIEREMDEEMRFHIEMEVRERIEQGMAPDDARRAALVAFGGVERFKERARDARGGRLWDDVLQDTRYGLRGLRRSPGFAAVALVTLALGIGATTAIFSVISGVMLAPLPYGEAERVVEVRTAWENQPAGKLSPAEYLDFRRLETFDAFGVYAFGSLNLTGGGEPLRVRTAFLTPGTFRALRVAPNIGRVFTPEEDLAEAPVVLLSHGFWEGRFGADADVIGRKITLNDEQVEVIGVMPAEFQLPEDIASGQRAGLFMPLGIDPTTVTNRGSHFLRAVAHLAAGVKLREGVASVESLAEWMVREFPDAYPSDMRFRATAVPIAEAVIGDIRPALLVLSGAVGFVLLIVCANLGNLQLARSDTRRRELALRAALGADRSRLVRQLLVESVVLALAGGALGMAIAYLGLELLGAVRPPNIPRLDHIGIDLRVLGFALAVSAATGLGFGLLPALQVSRADVARSLARGRGQAGDRSTERSRRALVVAEFALAVVLLACAGLFIRSFMSLYDVDPGFRPERVLTARISPPSSRYPGPAAIGGFYSQLVSRLSDQPGVAAAGAVSNLPLATTLGDLNFEREGQPIPEGQVSPAADWQIVTPGYFAAIGTPLLRGRVIEETDDADAPGVVVINEELAERYFPATDPLGKRFRLGGGAGPGWVTVVGIVPNVTHSGLDAEPRPQMYLAHRQFRFWGSGEPVYSMAVVLRSRGEPAPLTATLRRAVRSLDPALPVSDVRVMEEVLSASVSQPRLLTYLLSAFAVLALVLAGVGIYGVISYAVGKRTREFGVRMALGARGSELIGLVIRSGLLLVALGALIGVLGALLVGPLVDGLLFRVEAGDPLVLGLVVAFLAAVGLLASYVPAWRAGRVDPMTILRVE